MLGSGTITTLVSFNGTDGAGPLSDLVLDTQGSLYGTTTLGGANGLVSDSSGTVFELSPVPEPHLAGTAGRGDDRRGHPGAVGPGPAGRRPERLTDRVEPNWHRLQALESPLFAAFGRAAFAETLFGTRHVVARSLGRVVGLKNPAKRLVQSPCAGFPFQCHSRAISDIEPDQYLYSFIVQKTRIREKI
jgi:hypothetical protein